MNAGLAVALVCYVLAVGLVGRRNVAGMFSGVTGVVGSVVGACFGVRVSHSARRDAERSRQDAESKALRLAAAAPPEVAEKAPADPPPVPRRPHAPTGRTRLPDGPAPDGMLSRSTSGKIMDRGAARERPGNALGRISVHTGVARWVGELLRGARRRLGAGGERPRDLLARAGLFVGRTLRDEWHGIVVDPVRQLVRRGLSGLVLAFVAAFGVIFFHAVAQRPAGEVAVRLLGGVKADLPLWLALLRTPVSLYVPALDLPVWAGITQLFLAFALAELALGRARTLVVSYATTLAGTLTVRVMLAIGPGWWGLGLPPEIGQVLDTGPSAAVVGLFTYIAVVRRAPVVFVLTGGSMVWESIAVPNLAGREHLIAVAAAIVLGLLHGHRPRRLLPGDLPSRLLGRAAFVPAAPVPAPAPVSVSARPVAARGGDRARAVPQRAREP
ncbi:hypothetical protein ACF1A5_09245 [Streptomyces sp. NPDC014864]|uniref:hypothetical protein n=1 Tax=Streptomyces sp. NPDC014864 TaxID=3364924 RepID=UPI0036F7B34A